MAVWGGGSELRAVLGIGGEKGGGMHGRMGGGADLRAVLRMMGSETEKGWYGGRIASASAFLHSFKGIQVLLFLSRPLKKAS